MIVSREKAKLLALRALRRYGVKGRKGKHFQVGVRTDGKLFVRVRSGEIKTYGGAHPDQPDYYEVAHEFIIDPQWLTIDEEKTVPWEATTLREKWHNELPEQEAKEHREAWVSYFENGMWNYHKTIEQINKAFEEWIKGWKPLERMASMNRIKRIAKRNNPYRDLTIAEESVCNKILDYVNKEEYTRFIFGEKKGNKSGVLKEKGVWNNQGWDDLLFCLFSFDDLTKLVMYKSPTGRIDVEGGKVNGNGASLHFFDPDEDEVKRKKERKRKDKEAIKRKKERERKDKEARQKAMEEKNKRREMRENPEQFTHSGLTIINANLLQNEMKEAVVGIDKAITKLKSKGMKHLIYGRLFLVDQEQIKKGFHGDPRVWNEIEQEYKKMGAAGGYYSDGGDHVVLDVSVGLSDYIYYTFVHELGHRQYRKFLSPSERNRWKFGWEGRVTKVTKTHIRWLFDVMMKSTPKIQGTRYYKWDEFDYRKFLTKVNANQKKHHMRDVLDGITAKYIHKDKVTPGQVRAYVYDLIDREKRGQVESYGGIAWCSKYMPKLNLWDIGKLDVKELPIGLQRNPREDYEYAARLLDNVESRVINRMNVVLPLMVGEMRSTTEYGKNNNEEDFCEAFIHFIMNKPMPEDIMNNLKKTIGYRKASKIAKRLQSIALRVASTKTITHKGVKVRVQDEVLDSHGGELFCRILLYGEDGKPIAGADYSVHDNKVWIKWIETTEQNRRQGLATLIVKHLEREYGKRNVKWSSTTPSGTKLRQYLKRSVL